jgi:hypothetical protein
MSHHYAIRCPVRAPGAADDQEGRRDNRGFGTRMMIGHRIDGLRSLRVLSCDHLNASVRWSKKRPPGEPSGRAFSIWSGREDLNLRPPEPH